MPCKVLGKLFHKSNITALWTVAFKTQAHFSFGSTIYFEEKTTICENLNNCKGM